MRLFRLFAQARAALPRVMPLVRDARVPFWFKAAAVLSALLIISPLDVFGDIPIIGLFDDFALLALVVNLFVQFGQRWTLREVTYARPARVVNPALEP